MSSRFLCVTTLGLFLFGSMSLLAAPTKEEKDVDKYSKMLKSGKKPEDKVNAAQGTLSLGDDPGKPDQADRARNHQGAGRQGREGPGRGGHDNRPYRSGEQEGSRRKAPARCSRTTKSPRR